MPTTTAEQVGLSTAALNQIDDIAKEAIEAKATPGCVVMVLRKGKIAFKKSYGNFTFDSVTQPMNLNSVFDMASVTKICATTISIMKLYDKGLIKLDEKLSTYLPWTINSDKANLTLRNILLHQAGLVAYIPFYKSVIDSSGIIDTKYFKESNFKNFQVPVANNIFMAKSYLDTINSKILASPLGAIKYVYSDNDFIFLGKIVEQISGKTLDEFVADEFYKPMGLFQTQFLPLNTLDPINIVPTENEKFFRNQLLKGFVHDPGSAMMGGVAGHAGLFSDVMGIAGIMQVLISGGSYNGTVYLRQSTIELFTQYGTPLSRRALGFDKPEKDNLTRKDPYPCKLAPAATFGHTGFTGTCTWADPKNELVYVFLSNRVHPDGGDNKKLLNMNIRGKIHDVIYNAIID